MIRVTINCKFMLWHEVTKRKKTKNKYNSKSKMNFEIIKYLPVC